MTKTVPLMMPGVVPAGTLEVTAPYDGSVIATLETVDQAGIEDALSTANKLFQDRSLWLSLPERIGILERTAKLLEEHQEALAMQAALEGGKPLVDSLVEAARAVDGVKICVETLRTQGGHVIPMRYNPASAKRVAFTQFEPRGVVVALSAFNHPLNLIVHQVAPAIAVGCPVIVKPAKDTPISCIRFVELLREAGLPEEWCQVAIINDHAVTDVLVRDSRVAFLSFICSADVGWMLRSKLAPGTRCALEHGGVAPVIIAEDADLEATLPMLAKGAFYHAGQVCVSVQRVFAHHAIAFQVAKDLAMLANHMKVGDPTKADTDIGPLIRQSEVTRVHEWVSEADEHGADVLSGGNPISSSCYAPTVLFNPSHSATVSQKEVFGPVVCVYGYEELDEAIERANALPFAFQAAAFTKNLDRAMYCYTHLNASAVMINEHTAFRVDAMPFAGLKHSGLGVGGIPHTMQDMQIEKMMVLKSEAFAHL